MSVLSPAVSPSAAVPPAAPPPPPAPDPNIPTVPIYRLSVEQYHAMIEHGILQSGDAVELLEGWLVAKMTKHPPHIFATQSLRDLLPPMVAPDYFVNDQEPVTTEES